MYNDNYYYIILLLLFLSFRKSTTQSEGASNKLEKHLEDFYTACDRLQLYLVIKTFSSCYLFSSYMQVWSTGCQTFLLISALCWWYFNQEYQEICFMALYSLTIWAREVFSVFSITRGNTEKKQHDGWTIRQNQMGCKNLIRY